MPNTISIANHRGGVGKSTTTMMVAEGLSLLHDKRVLVLDFDPQAMVTVKLIGAESLKAVAASRATMLDFLLNRLDGQQTSIFNYILTGVSDVKEIHSNTENGRIDLIPMHPSLLGQMTRLDTAMRKWPAVAPDVLLSDLLSQEVSQLEGIYDLVLIDTAAGATPLSLSALRSGDIIIAPTLLEQNSLTLLTHFLQFIVDEKLKVWETKKDSIYILPTLFVRSNPSQQLLLDQLLNRASGFITAPFAIPHSTALQRAALHPGPGSFRLAREKYSAAYTDLQALAEWVARKLSKLERANAGEANRQVRSAQRPR